MKCLYSCFTERITLYILLSLYVNCVTSVCSSSFPNCLNFVCVMHNTYLHSYRHRNHHLAGNFIHHMKYILIDLHHRTNIKHIRWHIHHISHEKLLSSFHWVNNTESEYTGLTFGNVLVHTLGNVFIFNNFIWLNDLYGDDSLYITFW